MNSVGVRCVGVTRVYSHSKVTAWLVFKGVPVGFPSPQFLSPSYLSPWTCEKKLRVAVVIWDEVPLMVESDYDNGGSTLSWPGALGRRLQGWVAWASWGHWLVTAWTLLPPLFLRQERWLCCIISGFIVVFPPILLFLYWLWKETRDEGKTSLSTPHSKLR